jgi:6-phosphogluconolactonase
MRFSAFPLAAAVLFPVTSFAAAGAGGAGEPLRVYVGTYTRGESRGIYLFEMDRQSGELRKKGLAAEVENPSFLTLHPSGRFLFSVGEISSFRGRRSGVVSAFAIEASSGKLTLINQQETGGAGPCHVSVDATGAVVLVANYGGGSVAAFPVAADGSLGERAGFQQHEGSGPHPERQERPHAHSIFPHPSGAFALAVDLGIDQVRVYRLGLEEASLEAHDPAGASLAAGAGPRHLAFHPQEPFVYVINELNSTITAFVFDGAEGELRELQTVDTLPAGFEGTNHPAEILVHPDGRFLYGSNRGADTLAIFHIRADGTLEPRGHEATRGRNPRNFGIDPEGRFLIVAHQDTDNLVSFQIDGASGALKLVGETGGVSMPVCVRFR